MEWLSAVAPSLSLRMQDAIRTSEFVIESVARSCNADVHSIGLQTTLSELGADSLALLAVISQVEAVYGVDLGSEATMGIFRAVCIADVVELVERVRCER